MALVIKKTARFKRDEKTINIVAIAPKLAEALNCLASGQPMPTSFNRHRLIGNYSGYEECHLAPDILLVFYIDGENLYVHRIGSHSKLFKK
jgi:mRNA interferase YafQ